MSRITVSLLWSKFVSRRSGSCEEGGEKQCDRRQIDPHSNVMHGKAPVMALA
jgi:hypothetical protein